MAPRPVADRRADFGTAALKAIEKRVDVIVAIEQEREPDTRPLWVKWRARMSPVEHDHRIAHFDAGEEQRAGLISFSQILFETQAIAVEGQRAFHVLHRQGRP